MRNAESLSFKPPCTKGFAVLVQAPRQRPLKMSRFDFDFPELFCPQGLASFAIRLCYLVTNLQRFFLRVLGEFIEKNIVRCQKYLLGPGARAAGCPPAAVVRPSFVATPDAGLVHNGRFSGLASSPPGTSDTQ